MRPADASNPERECLADAVYFEAQGEPIEGQLAVAEVVLNRAASGEYPSSICEVVTQPAQFSFVRDGRFPDIDRGSDGWRKAVAVAHVAAEHLAGTLSSDVLWYHADYVAPSWGRRLERVTQIGAHIFYRRGWPGDLRASPHVANRQAPAALPVLGAASDARQGLAGRSDPRRDHPRSAARPAHGLSPGGADSPVPAAGT